MYYHHHYYIGQVLLLLLSLPVPTHVVRDGWLTRFVWGRCIFSPSLLLGREAEACVYVAASLPRACNYATAGLTYLLLAVCARGHACIYQRGGWRKVGKFCRPGHLSIACDLRSALCTRCFERVNE